MEGCEQRAFQLFKMHKKGNQLIDKNQMRNRILIDN